jgi:hypothetical protein
MPMPARALTNLGITPGAGAWQNTSSLKDPGIHLQLAGPETIGETTPQVEIANDLLVQLDA